MARKAQAVIQFEAKLKVAVNQRDWSAVAHLFHLYGCYLELIEPVVGPTRTQDEKVAFRKDWDKRVDEGKLKPVTGTPVGHILPNEAPPMPQYYMSTGRPGELVDDGIRAILQSKVDQDKTIAEMFRKRDEKGNAAGGCLLLIAAFILLLFLLGSCVGGGGTSDCYSTPGAQPGSAQADRDIQRCITS